MANGLMQRVANLILKVILMKETRTLHNFYKQANLKQTKLQRAI